ncbi:LuxR family two component transcriptional regulator [Frondihabitans sp. PhB188]|uniref:response regulator transcription factor n=1 Tax=Frondihabitans sp. PhB188 TaxID=2485200 RepID=UPI000F47520C|nr:response regulator transcription factor [Frondihabitans sp. PhB188]ROQ31041.1 LuxR family two component transcriptional regulator [Frondihabitans sp. PhB188]
MIRLLLVDDQEMIRIGLRGILGRHGPFEIVAEAADGLGAVDALASQPVDVVLMDIRMPGIDGVEATRRIREQWTAEQVRIIMLTTFEQDANVLAALRAGANAFLSKAAGPRELISAIEEVVAGGGALSPSASATLIGRVKDEPATVVDEEMAAKFEAVTPRERDVVLKMMTGLDVDGIAAELFLSPFTVKTHANRAMTKVGARDRAQLVAFAYRAGLQPN